MYADRFTVVLDANVLAPVLKRNLLLSFAHEGLFRVRWSDKILQETEHTMAKLLAGDTDKAADQAGRIRRAFPEAEVEFDRKMEASLELPDENDTHVLAAAIACRASVIVTDNLRDFPNKTLRKYGMSALSADDFLADCIDLYSGAAVTAVRRMRERFAQPAITADVLLTTMIARGLKKSAALLIPFEWVL